MPNLASFPSIGTSLRFLRISSTRNTTTTTTTTTTSSSSSSFVRNTETDSNVSIVSDDETESDPQQTYNNSILTRTYSPNRTIREAYSADCLILLLKQIRFNDPTLRQIVLDRRGNGKRLPTAYLRVLLEAVRTNTYVKRIRMHKVGIDDTSAVAEVIRFNRSVSDLHLTKSDITDNGCIEIATAIRMVKDDTPLRRLVLEASMATDVGIVALCKAVMTSPIQVLKIGRHKLGDQALDSIVTMLRHPNCALRKLDLRSCQLEDQGATRILEAIATNTSLQSLCLGRNNLKDCTIQALARALRTNDHLQTLDLQYNHFTDNGVMILAECLRTTNHSFQKVKLRHCTNVSDTMKEYLLDLLILHTHGPVLALRTKQALESLIQEEQQLYEAWEENNNNNHSSSTSMGSGSSSTWHDNDTSTNHQHNQQDGGRDGIIRETKWTQSNSPECCVICFDPPAMTVALLPCKHRNCCAICAAKLKTCHMCRETIVKVYPLAKGKVSL